MSDPAIVDIDSGQLRKLMSDERERDYILIDVREPDEYQSGHIPGAHNLPLMLLIDGAEPIPSAPKTVFYCLGGKRSLRAAQIATGRGVTCVHNLVGGITGWNGHVLPRVPDLRVFGHGGTLGDVLRSAIELEKGAERLYDMLAVHLSGTALESMVRNLAGAEVGHAHQLYEQLAHHEPSVESFDVVYGNCRGEILESGEAFEEVAALARRHDALANVAVVQLALDMELGAYDLYRNAAVATEKPTLKALFMGLAEHEKGHARILTGALATLFDSL